MVKYVPGPLVTDASGPMAGVAFTHRYGSAVIAKRPPSGRVATLGQMEVRHLLANVAHLFDSIGDDAVLRSWVQMGELANVSAREMFVKVNLPGLHRNADSSGMTPVVWERRFPGPALLRVGVARGALQLRSFGSTYGIPRGFRMVGVTYVLAADVDRSERGASVRLLAGHSASGFRPVSLLRPDASEITRVWAFYRFVPASNPDGVLSVFGSPMVQVARPLV